MDGKVGMEWQSLNLLSFPSDRNGEEPRKLFCAFSTRNTPSTARLPCLIKMGWEGNKDLAYMKMSSA